MLRVGHQLQAFIAEEDSERGPQSSAVTFILGSIRIHEGPHTVFPVLVILSYVPGAVLESVSSLSMEILITVLHIHNRPHLWGPLPLRGSATCVVPGMPAVSGGQETSVSLYHLLDIQYVGQM